MLHTSARKRALTAVVALAVAASGVLAPSSVASPSDNLKDKHKKVESSIKGAQGDLDESSHAAYVAGAALLKARTELRAAKGRLATTLTQFEAAKARDARLALDLARAKRHLARARAELDAAQARVVEQRAAVGRLAAQSVQGADPQLVGLVALMNSDDPSDLTTEVQATGNMLDKQDQVLTGLRRSESRLAVQETTVQRATAQVAAQRRASAASVVAKRALVAQAVEQKKAVAKLVAVRASAQQQAQRARDSDKSELGKLKKENARIQALLAARAAKAASYGNGGAVATGGGELERPVTGYVTSPFGYRIHPIYGYYALHDGTDFHAPCGTPLRAAGNGRVISEYYQTAWGNRLILDLGQIDGHGVSVIYNHLTAYRAHTGDTVSRGETVGYAGTTGWSTGCHLHFTVMVDGVPKDPMTFF